MGELRYVTYLASPRLRHRDRDSASGKVGDQGLTGFNTSPKSGPVAGPFVCVVSDGFGPVLGSKLGYPGNHRTIQKQVR
jgi:hypothetical protein